MYFIFPPLRSEVWEKSSPPVECPERAWIFISRETTWDSQYCCTEIEEPGKKGCLPNLICLDMLLSFYSETSNIERDYFFFQFSLIYIPPNQFKSIMSNFSKYHIINIIKWSITKTVKSVDMTFLFIGDVLLNPVNLFLAIQHQTKVNTGRSGSTL